MDAKLSSADIAFQEEVETFWRPISTRSCAVPASWPAAFAASMSRPCVGTAFSMKKAGRAPRWPVEVGGTGWTDMQHYIWASACARANAPRLYPMGVGMIGLTLAVCGTQAQKDHYLPKLLSGEHIWCQGYSEPGSGSDLASLQCKAERDGDDYIVNGTKIWTSYAHHANHIFCLVRTDTGGKPQQGISFPAHRHGDAGRQRGADHFFGRRP